MIKKITKFVLIELLYIGHLQSFGAVGIVYLGSLVLKTSLSWQLFVITYLNFQIIYYFDRFKDMEKDSKTNVSRSEHIKKYFHKIPILMLLMLLLLISLTLIYSNFFALLIFLTITLMGIFYPLYFKKLTKKILVFKNVYVSAVHAFLVFYPLIYFSQKTIPNTVFILILYVFTESMIGQILLDTKDVSTDKKEKMLTLPCIIGTKKTIVLTEILTIFSPFIFIPSTYFPLALATSFINLSAIYFIKNKNKVGLILEAGKFSLWLLLFLLQPVL